MYFSIPQFIKRLFPQLHWSLPSTDSVFLTFDDGPTPEVTEWVLAELGKYNAKATFFCIGKNAELYPEIVQRVRSGGHAIGNHTYSHNKGWGMGCERYVEDVDLGNSFLDSTLVRPPYGRITRSQIRRLSERYHLIMWNILSRDYSRMVSPERCVREVIPHLRAGAIIVFHDSHKASTNLYHTLPIVLKEIYRRGLVARSIEL
ncbi:MAG: polysaccharide deacetylase family protein [Rikenellaceae bacterium]